jgi:threonine 3-dehydrogenase
MAAEGIREGFDVALEMSGVAAALAQAIDHLNMGGCLALLGIPSAPIETDWSRIILKAIEIKGIYGREMFETWYKMLAMLESGLNVREVITHRYSANDFQTGFDTMCSGQSGKVILDWDAGAEQRAEIVQRPLESIEQNGKGFTLGETSL